MVLPPLGPSSFYDQLPVPKAAGPARRTLCRLSADTFKLGLGLLGIPSLEWMGGVGRLGEFRLCFLGDHAGLLPNPCPWGLHCGANV